MPDPTAGPAHRERVPIAGPAHAAIMMEHAKITAAHRERVALVYVRQSHPSQVERNRESTTRQYQLVARAGALGWPQGQVRVIDDDLGVTANGVAERAGFAELTAEV